jgi:CBS domain-containing protein
VLEVRACAATDDLRGLVSGVPEMMGRMLAERRTVSEINRAVSAIADQVTNRLLEMGEEKLGPPPVPYLWLAAGSHGRQELTASSDQDNSIVLDESYRADVHAAYFKALSTFVCGGMDACGYALCPGEMMAMTDRWRQPLSVWKGYFREWIEEPEPKALMLASVFFDFRGVRGATHLFDDLQRFILETSRRNTIFLTYLAGNAMSRRPPLGVFGNFQLERKGEHQGTLNLKLNGVTPIVELARVHAVAHAIAAVNTFERLELLGAQRTLSRTGAAELAQALEFIGFLRTRHQVEMARGGHRTDNHARLTEFSPEERKSLKAAFRLVKAMQSAMAATYRHGYL